MRCSFIITAIVLLAIATVFPNFAEALPSKQVVFSEGSKEIWVNGQCKELPASPYLSGDYVMVPVRQVAEALEGKVRWERRPETVVVSLADTSVELYPGSNIAFIWKDRRLLEARILPVEVQKNGGVTFVPALLFRDVFRLPYTKWSEEGLYVLGTDNCPPIAYFEVQEPVYAGTPVKYTVRARDREGDAIVEERWTGRQEVFPSPGNYTVTLQVKDSHGNWSKPFQRNIRVLPVQKELQPGEILTQGVEPEKLVYRPPKKQSGPKLLFSNSPEYVSQPGILYKDQVEEERARLYFWHALTSPIPLKVHILAVNNSQEVAELIVLQEGYGGPSNDVYRVAREALNSFFHPPKTPRKYTLMPREVLIINDKAPAATVYEVVHGIVDVEVRGKLQFLFVALPAHTEAAREYHMLPILPLDGIHTRGTFEFSEVETEIFQESKEVGALLLADGREDKFATGKDNISGSQMVNIGNYGVLYKIRFKPTQDTQLFLVAVSGCFSGSVMVNESIVNLPSHGFAELPGQAIFIGTLKNGQDHKILFMPPGGSCLPVKLVFKPL